MGNFTYDDLISDFTESLVQANNSKRSLRDISSSTRNILEYVVSDMQKLKKTSDWKILHGFLHTTSAEVDSGSVYKSILNLFHNHIQDNVLLSEELYNKLIGLSNIEHDAYYDEGPDNIPGEIKTFKGIVASKKLVSIEPSVFEYVFTKFNKKNKLMFLSYDGSLIINCAYTINYNIFKNTIDQKRYFFIKATFFRVKKDEHTQLIDSYIDRANTNSSHLLSEILNDFDEFMKLFDSNLTWPEGLRQDRKLLKLLQLISNPWVDRAKICGIEDKRYASFVTNPFIGKAPYSYISKYLSRKILEKINLPSLSRFELNEKVLSYLVGKRVLATTVDIFDKNSINESLIKGPYQYRPGKVNGIVSNGSFFEVLKNLKKIKDKKKAKMIIAPAGHGKSHLVKDKIDKIIDKNIMILTPTWKASEVYKKYKDLENIEIRTIQGCGHLDYLHEYDLIVFDEISMYSFEDWAKVANLMYKEAYFVGDKMQLDPVRNFGLVNHLIALKIPFFKTKELKKNHRIKDSKTKDILENINNQVRSGAIMDATSTYEHVLSRYSTYGSLFKKIKLILKDYKNENSDAETKIITQRNEGTIGVKNLNKIFINRNDGDSIFEVGDEIIITKDAGNDYFYSSRNLKISSIEDVSNNSRRYNFKDTTNSISCEDGTEPFEHALAITAHRSQGQSIDNVIVIIDKNMHVTYRWMYTAISRASKKLKIYIPNDFDFLNVENDFDGSPPLYLNKLFKE